MSAANLQGAPLVTRWASQVTATNVWPEYPRPQMVRDHWSNLNGEWQYAITSNDQNPPANFDGNILVPFPVESQLSGVARRLDEQSTLWYQRNFVVPKSWRGQRILIHFGAVDWRATVFLNGQKAGTHQGGYDSFTFDLTDFVHWDEKNTLTVAVQDPTEGDQPRGKQSRKPEGIFYSPSSGIWQTVWLEPVPAVSIGSLHIIPDFPAKTVRVRVMADNFVDDCRVQVEASFHGQQAGRAVGLPGAELTLPLGIVEPWSPAQPDLYDLTVTLLRGTNRLDTVRSYFGLRQISVAADENGVHRLFLNGKPLFEIGVLDQGFWPDGLYTAPCDEAMRHDLEMAKKLGFNLIRKHVKVEPERWYYWADHLGLLVWQDMPSGNNASEAGRRQFKLELERMLEKRGNHPSIVMWVLFNEGWGQFDTERIVRWIQSADPGRLVDNASGWTDAKVGDVIDRHSYTEPVAPSPDASRACVLGEFGGLGLRVDGHTWAARTWAYEVLPDAETLTERYCSLLGRCWFLNRTRSLAAAVYTQLTDVETECNGLITYDRAVCKVDMDRVAAANQHEVSADVILPDAAQGEYSWSYTTNAPAEDWMSPGFSDAEWKTGIGGFGTAETPGAIVNTPWNSPDIWLRRDFQITGSVPPDLKLVMHHDEDVEVYLNGVLALRQTGFTVTYKRFDLSPESLAALHTGRNVLAIHCHQTSGGQYIDAGLESELAPKRIE